MASPVARPVAVATVSRSAGGDLGGPILYIKGGDGLARGSRGSVVRVSALDALHGLASGSQGVASMVSPCGSPCSRWSAGGGVSGSPVWDQVAGVSVVAMVSGCRRSSGGVSVVRVSAHGSRLTGSVVAMVSRSAGQQVATRWRWPRGSLAARSRWSAGRRPRGSRPVALDALHGLALRLAQGLGSARRRQKPRNSLNVRHIPKNGCQRHPFAGCRVWRRTCAFLSELGI